MSTEYVNCYEVYGDTDNLIKENTRVSGGSWSLLSGDDAKLNSVGGIIIFIFIVPFIILTVLVVIVNIITFGQTVMDNVSTKTGGGIKRN